MSFMRDFSLSNTLGLNEVTNVEIQVQWGILGTQEVVADLPGKYIILGNLSTLGTK